MGKPPKRMEPESVELSKTGRSATKAFQADSFANYMARKIDGQRKEKGCVLPPDPRQPQHAKAGSSSAKKGVRFAPDVVDKVRTSSSSIKRRRNSNGDKDSNKQGMKDLVKRLKVQHGHGYSRRESDKEGELAAVAAIELDSKHAQLPGAAAIKRQMQMMEQELPSALVTKWPPEIGTQTLSTRHPPDRPDLFFFGIVILVNGYTNPDTETLNRIMHKHGGDLEKYETSRVTHIIAENLSTAKANVYKQRIKPRPVCKPSWIVDSVAARRLLPYHDYLLDDIRKEESMVRPITSYFFKHTESPASAAEGTAVDQHNVEYSVDTGLLSPARAIAADTDTPTTTVVPNAPPPLITNSNIGAVGPAQVIDKSVAEIRHEQIHANRKPEGNALPQSHESGMAIRGRTDGKYINGRIRTIGTDPNFLESFFSSSRLSFIGSYKQRVKASPTKKAASIKNKWRFVMHVDMDCFFCAVVLRSFPQYKNMPVVISHHGMRKTDIAPREIAINNDSTSECATCNYEARKYGITKGMYLGQAKQLCRDLVVLHYDFEGFEEVSEQVTEILHRHAAKYDGSVEQVSCDESYVELFLKDNADQSIEDIGQTVRREILEETQCTATVGIGSNKLLARVATDKVKPDGLFFAADYRVLLRDLRLRDLHGIGRRLEQKLLAEGFEFVSDVWVGNKDDIIKILGKATGTKLYDMCHGRDDRPVEPAERKSIGAECNYGVRFNGQYGPEYALDRLSEEVEKRMALVGVKGTRITLKVKQRKEGAPPPPKFLGHGSCNNLSKSRDTPNGVPSRDCHVIRDVCIELYTDMVLRDEDVRGIGIVVTKLLKDEEIAGRTALVPAHGIQRFFGNASANETTAKFLLDDENISVRQDVRNTSTRAERPFVLNDVLVRADDHFDFELPPLSQIRMSQIDYLPSPMRRNAMRKIDDAKFSKERGSIVKPHELDGSGSRLKQTNVKRLFKLAAVKTGEAPLNGVVGDAVSLRDLECLPLEMQLQLANNDFCGIGMTTKLRKNANFSARSQPRGMRPSTIFSPRSPKDDNISTVDEDDIISSVPLFENMDPDSFFLGDLFPLNAFLDENPPDDVSAQHVTDFFDACVTEDRLQDVSVLLRSMRNRNDCWSQSAFEELFQHVDELVFQKHKRRLDKDWLCSA